MTVKELREILFEIPDDLNVYFENNDIFSVNVYENYRYTEGKVKSTDKFVELS